MNRAYELSRLLGLAGALLSFCSNGVAATGAEQAENLFQAQEWQASARAYEQLIGKDPDNITYLYRLGRSRLELQQYENAIEPLTRVVESESQLRPRALYSLARAHAGMHNDKAVLEVLSTLSNTPSRPYAALRGSVEFADYIDRPVFIAALDKLKPCGVEHRAFDFWVGEWTVTAPTRPGWSADSSISQGNDGCSIHESYSSMGGYTGSSINFYDQSDEQWHQTWIDNQGGTLYLAGGMVDGKMIMADNINRITWSVEPDGRIRQQWETTADEGKTWTSVFDGFYSRKESLSAAPQPGDRESQHPMML